MRNGNWTLRASFAGSVFAAAGFPRFALALLGLCGLALAGGACGDDANGGQLATGVDKNRPLGMATPGEAQQICRSTEQWALRALADGKHKEPACKLGGLFVAGTAVLGPDAATTSDAQLQMACKTARDACLAATSSTAPGGNGAMCEFPANCTATVAEYEACANAMLPFIDSAAATAPACEAVNRLSLLTLAALVTSFPPACRTFQMKCAGAGIPGLPGIPTVP
jgi:hypothetical protein